MIMGDIGLSLECQGLHMASRAASGACTLRIERVEWSDMGVDGLIRIESEFETGMALQTQGVVQRTGDKICFRVHSVTDAAGQNLFEGMFAIRETIHGGTVAESAQLVIFFGVHEFSVFGTKNHRAGFMDIMTGIARSLLFLEMGGSGIPVHHIGMAFSAKVDGFGVG